MKFGLEVQVIENIISILEQYPKVDKAFVFGSRAKGNYRPDSDIDIAIKGNDITTDDIIAISVAIETKGITHKFDLLDYNNIKEPALKEHIDRVGIEFYSRWKTVMLQEIVSKLGDGLHGSPEYDINGEYFFINGNNLIDGKIVIKESTQRVSEKEYLKYKKELNDRTILLGINGTIGNVALYNEEKCILGKSACYFNVINSVNKDYIKYVITDKTFQSYIENFANGSTIMNVSLKVIREYEFSLPPFQEQTTIASILSSLDDKIDLLHSQNKTLEQLAETLFRQWFVEEAEEYEIGCLGDVISIYDNLRVPVSSMERDKMKIGKLYPYYGAAKIMDYINKYIFDGEYVLIGEDGTVQTEDGFPILQMPTGKFWVNNHTHVLQAIKPYSNYLIYIFLKRTNINHLITGAVQPKINQENLKSLDFPILPDKKVSDFVNMTNEYWGKIKSNQTQICTLTQTREILLPKMMSGELRVKIDN